MTKRIPLFVVYDKTTQHIYEQGFSARGNGILCFLQRELE